LRIIHGAVKLKKLPDPSIKQFIGVIKTVLVSNSYMHYDEFRGFAPIGIME